MASMLLIVTAIRAGINLVARPRCVACRVLVVAAGFAGECAESSAPAVAPEMRDGVPWARFQDTGKSKSPHWAGFRMDGRGDRIRTCDFYLPKVALYQAELHPDS